ncbi:MAG: cobalamin-dependent protein, partial [Candidatus Hydrogenedentes bacterium]|nr:cobalamin-dependent protein [Candidatus Hydrogenedentota bacterium]
MKILLTMPPTEGIAPSRPPLALGYLAASLGSDDHEVIIRDYRLTSQMPVDEAAVAAAREEPDLVAIATETIQLDDCLELARLLSQEHPETTVVLFGPHPTAKPLETLAHDGVDIVVTGETEQTMPELARRLERGESAAGVAGCVWKDNGELRANPARPILKNIDLLPIPDRDALQVADYPLKLHSGERMTNMITTRGHPQEGVPYRPTGFAKKYRVRSPEQVVNELADLVEHRGYRAVLFEDPGFTFDQSRLRRILKLIESRDLVVRWECIGLVDVLAEEDYNRMARAGCAAIRFESLTANTLAAEKIGYKISESQVRDAIRWCKNAGIRAKSWFITGLPC